MLSKRLGPAALTEVVIWFPDPWPKKRHHKRRFFRASNAARLADVLAPEGLLRVKTDHDGYAAVIGEVLAGEPRLAPVAAEGAFEGIPGTHYEIKYGRESRKVHRFAYRRL